MNLKTLHNVYFIGIGGIGMSALARYFKAMGKNVAGYDKTQSPLTKKLDELGIAIHFEDDFELVPETFLNQTDTLVVYTPAVPVAHSEYQYFLKNNFSLKKRSEVLGLVTKDSFCFAVAGTHGKTTTSSILAHLLKETNVPFMAFLGGISEDFNSNFVMEGTKYAVVEADEFDRSFLRLFPNVACVTSMDADHLDIYGSETEIQKSFTDFANLVAPDGKLFIKNGLPLNGIPYGIDQGAAYGIENINIENGTYIFNLITPNVSLKNVRFSKPGRHNLLNALAALAMATQSGTSVKALAKALETFKGVERRFTYQIRHSDFIFIDDYAHHPVEINAVHAAVTEMHPGKKILVVFQPHLYSRTRDFASAFASSLSKFDSVILLPIYPAREHPIAGISSEWLLQQMVHPQKKTIQKTSLLKEIKKQQPDILVTLGAGDIGLEVQQLKNELNHA